MKNQIELYIGGEIVELSENVTVLMTYQTEDTQNPTAIKNNFSKTIQIDGTPNNRRIFGSYYDVVRIVGGGGIGKDFNPSRRVDFTLYNNGEIVESGYCKLNRIRVNNGKVTFDCTLFGGLGDFIYNLTSKDEKSKLKLSDLVTPYDGSFPFVLDREFVQNSWDYVNENKGTDNIHKFVNFAPCYNGIPDNVTADKVLIDKRNLPFNIEDVIEVVNEDEDEVIYSSNGNFYVSNLNGEYDEFQMRDIKAVNQRPVVNFKILMEAMFDPVNNGGYNVDLDADFFNDENPYWNNCYLTRPLVSEMKTQTKTDDMYLYENGDKYYFNGIEDGTEFKVSIPFSFKAKLKNIPDYKTSFYLGCNLKDRDGNEYLRTNKAFNVIALLYDSNDRLIKSTPLYKMTSDVENTVNFSIRNDYYATVVLNTKCKFRKSDDDNLLLTWSVDKNNKPITQLDLSLTGIYKNGMYIKIVSEIETINDNRNYLFYYKNNIADRYDDTNIDTNRFEVEDYSNAYSTALNINLLKTMISKEILLNDDYTPADYLISYIKMFNLHLVKDTDKKTIKIITDKNYYNNNFVNLDDLIDRNDDVEIIPLSYSTKWYQLNSNYVDDSALSKKYRDIYGIDYGNQLIDTNYNFDSSITDMLPDNSFASGIMNRRIDRYNTNISTYNPYTGAEGVAVSFMVDGFTPILYNNSGDTKEGAYIQINGTGSNFYEGGIYQDLVPKLCLEDKDNKGIDGKNILLFYDGKVNAVDVDGKSLNYILTDTIKEFETLNENKMCWVYTNDDDSEFATKIESFPVFSRWLTNNDWVSHTWDFGTPREVFVTGVNIDNTSDIYHRYWDEYVTDRFDENTRTLTAKVWLRERVLGEWLRRIYYFDGCYWYLNKIIDYNQCSYDTTKCEFIKKTNF